MTILRGKSAKGYLKDENIFKDYLVEGNVYLDYLI